jgi:hypothetical protein
VNATVRIGADDTTGLRNLARYLIRVPFSLNKIRCDPGRRAEPHLRDLRPAGRPGPGVMNLA